MPRYPELCDVSASNLQYGFAVDPGSREDLEPCRQKRREALILVTPGYAGSQRCFERGNMIRLRLNFGQLTSRGIAAPDILAANHHSEP